MKSTCLDVHSPPCSCENSDESQFLLNEGLDLEETLLALLSFHSTHRLLYVGFDSLAANSLARMLGAHKTKDNMRYVMMQCATMCVSRFCGSTTNQKAQSFPFFGIKTNSVETVALSGLFKGSGWRPGGPAVACGKFGLCHGGGSRSSYPCGTGMPRRVQRR